MIHLNVKKNLLAAKLDIIKKFETWQYLSTLSTIFGRTIHSQLSDFFNYHFNYMLSAFWPGYGCPSVLLNIVVGWKLALDHKKYMAAIMIHLLKVVDCIPHDIIVAKLNANVLQIQLQAW